MATVSKKSVDRQATFDTDPNRARLSRGGLKLPVIEGKEKTKDKSATNVSENKTAPNVPKDVKNESNDKKSTQNKPKVSKSVDEHNKSPTKNDVKNEKNKSDPNNSATAIKTSETNKKSNALLSVNKKVTAPTSQNSSHPTKDVNKKPTDKNTSQNEGSVKGNKNPIPDKSGSISSNQTNSVSKSSNQTKVRDSKPPDSNEKNNGSKHNASQKTLTNTNKNSKANESAKESKPAASASDKNQLPKTSEKPTQKSTVLKDLNDRGSVSPNKGNNTPQQKNSNSTPRESVSNSNTTRAKESPTPKPRETVTSKSVYSSQKTGNSANTNVKQTKQSNDSNKKGLPGDKNNEKDITSSTQIKNQPSVKTNSPTVQKESKTVNDDKNVKREESKKSTDKVTLNSPVNSLPLNHAPNETNLPKNDKRDKNDSLSPRQKHNNEKVKSTSPKDTVHLITVEEERTADFNLGENSRPVTEHTNESRPVSEQTETSNSGQESYSKRTLYSHNLRFLPSTNDDFNTTDDITDNTLKADTQSKHETYVVSPSVSKIFKKPPAGSKQNNVGRLSPSNETVEQLKLDQKVGNMDLDRKESYAQVYAERNTLLKAEITYRKRIKQLEEEANGFLKAIDDLTSENTYLRSRVDALEDQLRGQGDLSSVDKISDLERDKAELENKIKRLEKAANENKTSDETRELKELVVKLQSENQKLNKENVSLKSENEDINKKLEILSTEKKPYSKSDESVDSENKQTSKQIRDLNTKIKGLEKKVNSLEFENKTLSETLTQKKNELGELLGVMKDENKFDNEIKELKTKVTKLTKDKKDAEQAFNKEKRVFNENLQEIKAQLETKTNESNELKIKLDEKEKETIKLKSKAETSKKVIDEQKIEIERLKEENKRLMEEKDEYKEKYTVIVTESESAAQDISDAKDKLEQFNKDLQKIVNDKESQISKLINQLDTMREERELQRKTASEERDKLLSEREKNSDHMKNIRRLETDLKHFVEKLDEAKVKEKTLTNDLDDRNYVVSNLEKQVFELNMKMDNHSKRMNELDRDKREMEREKREWDVKKDKLDDIEASNRRLTEENRRLRGQIEMGNVGSQPDYRMPDHPADDKPVVEAWVKDGSSHTQAIYVQKEKPRDRTRKVQLVQPSIQKKRQPFSKSSPVKQKPRSNELKPSNPNTHRSLEDLRKMSDAARTPESEHSLPELSHDTRMTYAGFGGYREIHKNRIRAAHKRIY
ncbi:hypothetical protein ACF0H5_001914 [Mactra antiquata]